ncbi:SIMPL domain-containing protein [Asticcacaulis sp. ZE23SCel15]|uniref:SIMPL domain-containing protein n=1 Tax=Asticcacaulis sp. ZE23SCel15 TaxID=3059027 RepID=UPI00265D646A|nr:SIMPL domain-containing protein [Asticcacaulis sp. ZE23SCel15]WKL56149.1 SIMPL domain-containing protein [Asticcacaulis sp. ZE23SCel15]
MTKPIITTLSAVAVLMAGSIALPAAAQDMHPSHAAHMMPKPTTLNLNAQGEVKATPDTASINFGVMTEAKTAEEAMKLNRDRMTAVFAALKKLGIADKNIQTSNLNLNAQYDYPQNAPAVLRGYQASNRVTVKVDDLARLGTSIDAVVKAGINQIDGINFGLKDSKTAEDTARKAAVAALTQRADLYASAMGYKVKRIITLSESGGYAPQPVYKTMARAEMMDSTPIAAGELNIVINVSAEFELEK